MTHQLFRFNPVYTTGLACIFLLLIACNDKPAPAKPAATADGHTRMIAILDSIAENASPLNCYHLNTKKAAYWLSQLEKATPQQKPLLQFRYAEQLLNSGQNEMAIMQLQDLIQQFGNSLNDNTKLIFELLALGYMRLGEQQNCINTHTPESCIIPIQGEGVYKMTSGPSNAVKIYERILQQYPDDVQSRWLLNLAYMTLGKWPDAVPKQHLFPPSLFQSKGAIRFRDVAIPTGLDLRGISGGVCLDDFDNDGYIDLFATSYGLRDQCRFFHNNGDGAFSERTAEANLTGIVSGLNTLHADYDNDGDRDILILRGAWLEGGTHPNSLLRNNGDGTFSDVTIEAGLLSFHPTQAADWADFDGDGWLDLYIANETQIPSQPHPNEFYRNNGDGTFTNIAPQLGLNFTGFFKGAVWGDVDNDQRPDLYLSDNSGPNRLLMNRGGSAPTAWKFENVGVSAGVAQPLRSFPACFFDFNNDGNLDIFCADFAFNPKDPTISDYLQAWLGQTLPLEAGPRLYRNNGDGTFTDIHREAGMHTVTYAMGINFGDLDNDGRLDLYLATGKPDLRTLMPNRMYRNRDGIHFDDLTMDGFGQIQKGHGTAFADLDNDGDQDIYVVVGGAFEGDLANNILLENPGAPGRHYVTLMLEGKTCNRDALGARIAVNTVLKNGKKQTIHATVDTGGSFGAGSLRQEIGLGEAASIESVVVTWPKPGLAPTTYTNVPIDAVVKLTEGAAQPEVMQLNPFKLGKK